MSQPPYPPNPQGGMPHGGYNPSYQPNNPAPGQPISGSPQPPFFPPPPGPPMHSPFQPSMPAGAPGFFPGQIGLGQPQPGQFPEQQPYSYYPPPPQDPLWYLGTSIPDPNAPRAPMGVAKVPGYDPAVDYAALEKAKKSIIKTDNSAIIKTLTKLDVFRMNALDDFMNAKIGKSLPDYLSNISSGYFAMIIRALALGPLGFDVELARKATEGFGTKEALLTELILGRESSEIRWLITGYRIRYGRNLVDDVANDLSGHPALLFKMALGAQRPSWNTPVDHNLVKQDVHALHHAAKGAGTDEIVFFEILVNRSTPHIAAVIDQFGREYKSLSKVIKKEFSGHVRNALLYIVHGAKPKRDGQGIYRDAKLLEASMAGLGTKDTELVWRVVRGHWDPKRMEAIKSDYKKRYGKTLEHRVKGETSGAYKDALIAIIQASEGK